MFVLGEAVESFGDDAHIASSGGRLYFPFPSERLPMRTLAAVLFIFFFTVCVSGQKARFGRSEERANPRVDYPVKVRILGTHIRDHCTDTFRGQSSCENGLYADVLIDGKKMELFGEDKIDKHDFALILPGSYQARLTNDFHNQDNTAISQEYDLVLPDRAIWHCFVTGISE